MIVELEQYLREFFKIFLITAVTIWLVACGGGGDGDGGDDSFSYSGNTSPADIKPTNASRLLINLLGDTSTASSIVVYRDAESSSVHVRGQIGFVRRLSEYLNGSISETLAARSVGSRAAARIPIDQTDPCASGSTHLEGSLADNGTGNLDVRFNNCIYGGETINGNANIQIHAFDLGLFIYTDATYKFPKLTLTGPGYSYSVSGSIRSQLTIGTDTSRLMANVVTRDDINGGMTKSENLVIEYVYDNIHNPSSYSESITGRIFDSVHGFVDIETLVPFVFSTINQFFTDSGQLLLTGASNMSIKVLVLSVTTVMLELDLDGDGAHEMMATLPWQGLYGEMGSDLSDSDGDGMHNSWEQVNDLDPQYNDDAVLDTDADGFSNIEEYLGGSVPTNSNSNPPVADLSITQTTAPAAVLVGESLVYTITVRNDGPDLAVNVLVTDVLPANMTFNAVTSSKGSCTWIASVTCNLGSIANNSGATIDIVVTSTTESIATNATSVLSVTLDRDTTNNNATVVTSAGTSASTIQTAIDAAVDGDTITVAPGIYIGNIDFNGKAITVTSEQGPAVTIIDGNQAGSVATFDSGETNASVLSGFTIRNGFSSEGGGIAVLRSSPTITNNIIEDNHGCIGAGIAVGPGLLLVSAAPLIKENTIRNNNSCMGGGIQGGGISVMGNSTPIIQGNVISANLGGAISMANLSDALIVQNIISKNKDLNCGGIKWNLPSSVIGPRVINNTIVDNEGLQGSAICADGLDTETVVVNNIIVAGTGQTAIYCGGYNNLEPPLFGFNNVLAPSGSNFGGNCTDQAGINGNISVDPLFVSKLTGDYRLSQGSPAVDAGDNTAVGLPITDFAGNDRIVDGDGAGLPVIDMGAYEFVP